MLLSLLPVLAAHGYEDLATYTEADPDSMLTLSGEGNPQWTVEYGTLDETTLSLYVDCGPGAWDSAFSVSFTCYGTVTSVAHAGCAAWGVTKSSGSLYEAIAADGDCVFVAIRSNTTGDPYLTLWVVNDGEVVDSCHSIDLPNIWTSADVTVTRYGSTYTISCISGGSERFTGDNTVVDPQNNLFRYGHAFSWYYGDNPSFATMTTPMRGLNYTITGLGEPSEKATNPFPMDATEDVNLDVVLTWLEGVGATSHDVYFGTDPTPDATEFQANQGGASWSPGTLEFDTTYYWRVDEWAGETKTVGDVWSFTTKSPPPPFYVGPTGTGEEDGSDRNNLMSIAAFKAVAVAGDVAWLQPGDYGLFDIDDGYGSAAGGDVTYKADPETCTARSSDWWLTEIPRLTPDNSPCFTGFRFADYESLGVSVGHYVTLDGLTLLCADGEWSTAFNFRWPGHLGYVTHLTIRDCSVWGAYVDKTKAQEHLNYDFTAYGFYFKNAADVGHILVTGLYMDGVRGPVETTGTYCTGPIEFSDCHMYYATGGLRVWKNVDHPMVFRRCHIHGAPNPTIGNEGQRLPDAALNIASAGTPADTTFVYEGADPPDLITGGNDYVRVTHGAATCVRQMAGLDKGTNTVVTISPMDFSVEPGDTVEFFEQEHGSLMSLHGGSATFDSCIMHDMGNSGFINAYNEAIVITGITIENCLLYNPRWTSHLIINAVTTGQFGNNIIIRNNTMIGRVKEAGQDDGEEWHYNYGRIMLISQRAGSDPETVQITNNLMVGAGNALADAVVRGNIVFVGSGFEDPSNQVIGSQENYIPFNSGWFQGGADFHKLFLPAPHTEVFMSQFMLLEDADAVDAGSAVVGDATFTDFAGAERTAIPDVGAYEYVPGAPAAATNPNPAHLATGVSVEATLSWTAGAGAASHDVYFGIDSTPDAGEFQGNQAGTTFDPGTLDSGQAYYWRIDEVGAGGTQTGSVWQFTTEPPVTGAYYVDADAAPGGDGSFETPWQTLSQITGLVAGDTVLLKRGGLWRESLVVTTDGTAVNPITFGAYGSGDTPIISGANLITGWTVYSGNVWQATCATWPTQVWFDTTLTNYQRGKKEASIGAVDADYDWTWASGVLYTYSATDPDERWTAPGIEACVRPTDALQGVWEINADYIILDGLHIEKSGYRGLRVNAAVSPIIRNCIVSHALDGGIVVPGTLARTTNLLVEDCTVTRTGNRWHDGSQGLSEPISLERVNGFTVRRCKVHTNLMEGIVSKYGSNDGNIYHNIVYDNGRYVADPPTWNNIIQIYLDGSYNMNVFQNWVSGGTYSFQGIVIGCEQNDYPTHDIYVWGNVIRLCSEGVRFGTMGTPTVDMYDLYVCGNTFINCIDRGLYFNTAAQDDLAADIWIKNNIFWQETGYAILDATTGNQGLAIAQITHNGFQTGKDSEAKGTDYVETATPGFANYGGSVYELTETSPFIGAGADLGSPFYSSLRAGSTWTGSVVTADQRNYDAWEIGAYVWTGGEEPGITTTFFEGQDYQITVTWKYNSSTGAYGRFIGPQDHWAADANGITIMAATPLDGRTFAAVNPDAGYGQAQALCPHVSNWQPQQNILGSLVPANPATWVNVPASSSVVFLREYAVKTDETWAQAACVLTVLTSAPAANSFRPPWTGADKTVAYDLTDLNMGIFANVTEPANGPSFATCEAWFANPMLDWCLNPADYAAGMPRANMPRTGPDLASRINVAALKLNGNHPNDDKRLLAAYLVQYGLDLAGIMAVNHGYTYGWIDHNVYDMENWYQGRLIPAVLAARALDHSDLKAKLAKTGDYLYSADPYPLDSWFFAETVQARHLTAALVGEQTGWIGAPDFAVNGRRTTWTGPAYPRPWEPGAESYVSAAMVLYLTGSTGLTGFTGLLDYADYRWQVCGGQFTEQTLYPDWQENFYADFRATYQAVRPVCELLHADAGSNRTITAAQRDAVTLDGAGSHNWRPTQTTTSYLWTEGGATVATGRTPTIALEPGTHELILRVTDDQSELYDTDDVAIKVMQGWILLLKESP